MCINLFLISFFNHLFIHSFIHIYLYVSKILCISLKVEGKCPDQTSKSFTSYVTRALSLRSALYYLEVHESKCRLNACRKYVFLLRIQEFLWSKDTAVHIIYIHQPVHVL